MDKDYYAQVADVLGIVEEMYVHSFKKTRMKLDNLKRINIDNFAQFIGSEYEQGNISEKSEIVRYIENIISD